MYLHVTSAYIVDRMYTIRCAGSSISNMAKCKMEIKDDRSGGSVKNTLSATFHMRKNKVSDYQITKIKELLRTGCILRVDHGDSVKMYGKMGENHLTGTVREVPGMNTDAALILDVQLSWVENY